MKWNPYGWHITCSHCGNTVSSNRIDCPYCGQNIWLGYSPSEYTESIRKNERRNRHPMPSQQTKNHIWRMSDQGYTISEIATQLKLSRDEIIAIEANRHPQAKPDNTNYTQPTII